MPIERQKTDTLIISDLHLDSPIGKPQRVHDFLGQFDFKRLILLGDFFDHSHFEWLDDDTVGLVRYIQTLCKQNGAELVWVRGNHDHDRDGSFSRFVGVPVYEQYIWNHAGKRYSAIHGHQFDDFTSRDNLTDRLAHVAFRQVQRLDRQGRHLIKFIDRLNEKIRGLNKRISRSGFDFARGQNADYIFCGHTHRAVHMTDPGSAGSPEINYFNAGCWTHTPATFIVIGEKGEMSLREYA